MFMKNIKFKNLKTPDKYLNCILNVIRIQNTFTFVFEFVFHDFDFVLLPSSNSSHNL